MSDRIVF